MSVVTVSAVLFELIKSSNKTRVKKCKTFVFQKSKRYGDSNLLCELAIGNLNLNLKLLSYVVCDLNNW